MGKQEAQFTVFADDGSVLVNRGDAYDAKNEGHKKVVEGNPDVFPETASKGAAEPGPNADPEKPEPPAGNAGADKWRDYARSVGIEVADDATRDDVKSALVGAGLIEAPSA
jgi:hypothetical protein